MPTLTRDDSEVDPTPTEQRSTETLEVAFFDYVLDVATPGKSGLSDLVWNMASPLVDLGVDVTVVSPYPPSAAPDSRVRVVQFATPPIGYRNVIGHLWIIWRGYQALRRLSDINVIHTPEYLSSSVFTLLLRNLPVVVTEPGNIFERERNGNAYDRSMTFVLKRAARQTARACAQLIATSEEMGQWWAWTGVSPDRISRLPLGIDAAVFQQKPSARERADFDPSKFNLTYAARLSRENGAAVFLTAVANARELGVPVFAHILGSGPDEQQLREQARELGIESLVKWHGWVPFESLPDIYSASDAFVFTGFSGGTPRVLIQAMACGAPVIASRIGGIVDHVADGESGILCTAGDADEFAQAIRRLYEDSALREKLAAQGADYVQKNLTWKALARHLRDEIYPRALKSRRQKAAL